MLKKTLAVLVPLAAVVALSLVPAASGDFYGPKGTNCKKTPQYCTHFCVVPKLVGRHLKNAKQLLAAHNCKVGKIKRRDNDKACDKKHTTCTTSAEKKAKKREHGYEKGVVVKQKPGANTGSPCPGNAPAGKRCRPAGTKVNLTVEF